MSLTILATGLKISTRNLPWCTPLLDTQLALSVCLESADWIWILCLFKESNISQPSGSPSLRLSALCSCQGILSMSGVFPVGLDTWYSFFSLIFNLWCFPEPIQVVDCAAFPLCARTVSSSGQVYSSQRYQWETAACGNGRADWRVGNGSLHWRELCELPSRAAFSKGIIIQGRFQSWNLVYKKERAKGNATRWICQILDHEIFSECWQSLLGNPTYTIVPKAARHTGMKCLSKVNKQCRSSLPFSEMSYWLWIWKICIIFPAMETQVRVWVLIPCPLPWHWHSLAQLGTARWGWTQRKSLLFKCFTLLFLKAPHLRYGG